MYMTLSKLPAGVNAKVTAINGEGAVSRRLMEMGIVPGVSVRLVKSAPFGDPIEVRILGYSLAIRKNEADSVEVELLDTTELLVTG
jgi:Fe2+ transport system protein FeoA